MGIFDTDIVTSEVRVSIKEKFACDLSNMIMKNHKLLISALKTHGVTAVMNSIETYVEILRKRPEYYNYMEVSGRPPYRPSYQYLYVTYIKRDIYIVLDISPLNGTIYDMNGSPSRDECKGSILIILDQFLREIKFKVK